jgi:hypothetical protein
MVGVLRLLHRKANQIVTRDIDFTGRDRVQRPRQVAREDCPVHRLVTKLDANFGAVAIDEFCGFFPANEGHVVTRHRELRAQQGAVGGPQNQNIARHALSFKDDAEIFQRIDPCLSENFFQRF